MSIKLPGNPTEVAVSNYGDYDSANYGVHTMKFSVEGIGEFYFSYETMVAFRIASGRLYVIHNYWGATTGKHLNWIDGGRRHSRLTKEEFEEKFDEEMSAYAGNPNQGN